VETDSTVSSWDFSNLDISVYPCRTNGRTVDSPKGIFIFSAIPSSPMAEGIRFQNWAQARALWHCSNPPLMVRHNRGV
jgi:hypothetical protein